MSIGRALRPMSWFALTAAISLSAGGCQSSNNGGATNTGGSGGNGSGGTSNAGGTVGSGGSSTGSGGTSIASGGTVGAGGSSMSGGMTGGGGSSASGGTAGTSGGTSLGGATGSGGTAKTGGATTGAGGAAIGGATTGIQAGGASGGRTGAGGGAGGSTGGGAGGTSAGGGAGAPGTAGGATTGGQPGAGGGGVAGSVASGGSVAGGSTGAGGGTGTCPSVDFGTWTSGKAPADIGKLAVTNFKPHTGDAYSGAGYAWTFAYVASLQFTELTGDTTNNSYLISKFDCSQAGPANTSTSTVDDRAFGDLPLEIFLENQDAKCKSLGMLRADAQWANTADTAITPDARYWSDDMYMITGLQDFAYRATSSANYRDRTAMTMAAYIAALQKDNDTTTHGLFWHTKDTKAYWGRENGWFASGMALLLQDLPKSNSNYAAIMAAYTKQMDGLLPLQITSGTDVGAWRQVLDRTDAWAESSCTAMFTYALVTGIKNGWLSGDKYVTAAKNGWTALGNKTDSTGVLSKVCPGTGQAAGSSGVGSDLKSQQDFYINLTPGSNDQHGQAPLLWSAIALLRADCPGVR